MSGLNIDIKMVRDIAGTVGTESANYDANLSEMYSKFEELANAWSGPDYEAAKSVMTTNKQPLLDLGTTLHQMSASLDAVADDYENKIKASAAQFE